MKYHQVEVENSDSKGNDDFRTDRYDHRDLDWIGDETNDPHEKFLSDYQYLDQTDCETNNNRDKSPSVMTVER